LLPPRAFPKRGATLLEVIVSLSMVSLMVLATFLILNSSIITWRKVSGNQGAEAQLIKAESWLRRDVAQTAYGALSRAGSVTTLIGKDGDAVWFLSAIDPDTGMFVRNIDGTPRWQRNILYYLVVPTGKNTTGFSGTGIEDSGYEVSHPGKVMVRKVIDNNPDPAEEELIADISSFLEAPNDGLLNAPNSESASLVAVNLLGFRVDKDDTLQRVALVLQAAKLEEQQHRFAIGSQSLLDPQYLLERRFELFPENVFVPPSLP
jgi:type II secretory pathway component PulJ